MFLSIVGTIGPILVGIAAIIASHFLNRKTLNLKRNEDRVDLINRMLSEFYGPFQQLRLKSCKLYERFTIDKPKDFRTVRVLLSGHKFEGNDKILLEEILEIGEELQGLIKEKAGLVDDKKLRTEILPEYNKHTTLLKLMYEGKIQGEYDRFKDDVFPRELDAEIDRRINELQAELKEIKS